MASGISPDRGRKMVEAINANHMMQGFLTEGSADSGYGMSLKGFYCPNAEYPGRLEALYAKAGFINDFVTFEVNGYTLFMAAKRESYQVPLDRKIVTYRREPHKFFQDLPAFFAKTKAQFIDRMTLSGSMGSISLTLLYRTVNDSGV
jgi:hypothetical protein